MSVYDLDFHPVGVVYDLVQRYGSELEVSFSRYFYRPNSTFDERETFFVSAMDVTPAWVEEQSRILRPGWELALNSLVRDARGRAHHLGMIDFVGLPNGQLVLERMRSFLG